MVQGQLVTAIRIQFKQPSYFMMTTRAPPMVNPKDGVHVHWLLTHCAVFKERVALRPSS